MPIPIVRRPGIPTSVGDHETRIRALERKRLDGFIRYDFLNVGDWLDVAMTDVGPSGFPAIFDTSQLIADSENNHGGVLFRADGSAVIGPNSTGLTVEASGGYGATVWGEVIDVDIRSGGPSGTAYGTFTTVDVADEAMAAYGHWVEVTTHGDASSADGVHATATAADQGSATAVNAQGVGIGQSDATGVSGVANTADGDAYGIFGSATCSGAGIPYSGYFQQGNFQVQLAAGQTLTVLDHLFAPKIRFTEGSPDLHIPTGGTVIADL